MRIWVLVGGTAVGTLLAVAGTTGASAGGYGACRAGAAVTDRYGQSGTVIDDSDPAACRVRLANGSERNYLSWMLSAAGAAGGRQTAASTVSPGNYQCYGGDAGNMRITLNGARWNGMYAAVLPDGRVGLSSRPNGTPYYMVCERR